MHGMRLLIPVAGLHGAMAVAVGAYAAHGMAAAYAMDAVEWTRTGAFYQLVHAVALLALAALANRWPAGPARWAVIVAGWAFALGPALFAGALYGLAFGGSRALAMAAPVGGGLMILGWIAVATAGCAALTPAARR